jgi:2-dehydropantoate 2-reductase
MRLLVMGAGSTGGYFGGRLAQAGRDVTFLVRERRAAQLRAEGLEIISSHGGFMFAPKFVTAKDLGPDYDAVLLAVKAYSLADAITDVAPAAGPGTMILPVLNGMRHMEVLRARFGEQAVAGCVCRIAAHLDDRGRVVQLSNFHDLAYGEMSGLSSPRMSELDSFMQNAGFNAILSSSIEQEMWEKWLLLSTLGGITCLLRGSVGEIFAAPGGSEFINRFLDEAVSIISATGKTPRPEILARIRAILTESGSSLTSSMFRDLESGMPVEADQIIGDLLARGESANIKAPLLSLARTHLAIYQDRLSTKY